MIYTYIIQTNGVRGVDASNPKKDYEYYCGITTNIDKRLKEHLKEKRPHWFGFKNRKKKSYYALS